MMNSKTLILNTYIENKFAVYNGSKWFRFMVKSNINYHKDSNLDFWLVVDEKTKKEHKLLCNKGQELFNEGKLKLL